MDFFDDDTDLNDEATRLELGIELLLAVTIRLW